MNAHGASAPLTRDQIIEAALDLVTREGGNALSMRRVATAVGAAPMSIYRHVRGREELLTLLMDRVIGALPRPDLPVSPRDRLLTLLTWQHERLAERPWIVEVLIRGELAAPSLMWLMEDVYTAWTDCGLTLDQATRAHRIVWVFTFGDLVQRIHPGSPGASQVLGTAPGPAPHMEQLGDRWNPHGGQPHFPGDLIVLVDALISRPGDHHPETATD
ncbi:TetR/AcrR family transcriptional regulator [Actinomadura flavalba]|uniref:TetR/AcrR family transcriptional regulator n=1 Tax=Actinomadura flavalba TaxID=1120938 RepID=UPI000363847B|nr:TetR/AcrR family transcriptional regulator [Actinomadura flavalba]